MTEKHLLRLGICVALILTACVLGRGYVDATAPLATADEICESLNQSCVLRDYQEGEDYLVAMVSHKVDTEYVRLMYFRKGLFGQFEKEAWGETGYTKEKYCFDIYTIQERKGTEKNPQLIVEYGRGGEDIVSAKVEYHNGIEKELTYENGFLFVVRDLNNAEDYNDFAFFCSAARKVLDVAYFDAAVKEV